jgi:hypothetical protein
VAVRGWHMERRSFLGEIGFRRKTVVVCASALLLLVVGVVMIDQFDGPTGKQPANRIVSPLDNSMAPPAFVPSQVVKVKRTTRVIVIPEKKQHSRRDYYSIRGYRTHHHRMRISPTDEGSEQATGPATRLPATAAGQGSGPRAAEPPAPEQP